MLEPGIAFPLVRKLLALNEGAPADAPRVEVILISRNSADTGLRIFNSIAHHGLAITARGVHQRRADLSLHPPFGAHLFLSAQCRRRAQRAGGTASPRRRILPAQGGRSSATTSCASPSTATR